MTPNAKPSGFPDARDLLKKHGLRAKKSWGQNFLVDEKVYADILRAAEAGPQDWVIEIGAGLGTLTMRLAQGAREVIAIERDRDLAAVLREELGENPKVVLIEGNALHIDYGELAARVERPPIAVGNLPYQIASPILFRLLEARPPLGRIVVMVQKEMADRMVAKPGTKEYGAMTVMVRMEGEPRIVRKVSRGAFHPAPRVDSAVVRIDPFGPRGGPRVAVADPVRFSEVVHAAFGQRRKTLRNALQAIAKVEAVDAALGAAKIDGGRRGETLDVKEFARLADALPRATT